MFACFLLALLFNLGMPEKTEEVEGMPVTSLAVRVLSVSVSGALKVEISNRGKSAVKLWRDSNSWGAARWRVVVLRNGHMLTFYQNPDQRFTRNIPVADEIALGTKVTLDLDLNSGNWCGFGACSEHDERGIAGKSVAFEKGDTVIVMYDVSRTEEAVRLGAWYGVVSAIGSVK